MVGRVLKQSASLPCPPLPRPRGCECCPGQGAPGGLWLAMLQGWLGPQGGKGWLWGSRQPWAPSGHLGEAGSGPRVLCPWGLGRE